MLNVPCVGGRVFAIWEVGLFDHLQPETKRSSLRGQPSVPIDHPWFTPGLTLDGQSDVRGNPVMSYAIHGLILVMGNGWLTCGATLKDSRAIM